MVNVVKNVHIEGGKVSGNAKVSGLDKYTDLTINGQKITSDGTYEYTPNITTSSSGTMRTVSENSSTNVVEGDPKKDIKTEKVVKDEKKVVKEDKKDTRSFWQRHPWLRVLLTISFDFATPICEPTI